MGLFKKNAQKKKENRLNSPFSFTINTDQRGDSARCFCIGDIGFLMNILTDALGCMVEVPETLLAIILPNLTVFSEDVELKFVPLF